MDHTDANGTRKKFLQNVISSRDGPVKGTKQDRDENAINDVCGYVAS